MLRAVRTVWTDPASRAVAIVFAFVSTLFGNWIARIPEVQAALGLSEGALGLALLGTPVGMLLVMPATSWMVARWGAGRVTVGGAMALAGGLALPPLAPSFATLTGALFIMGLGDGALNVAMNARASAVEKARGTAILSTCHGFFSVGGMVGAGMGSAMAAWDVPLPLHMGGVCAAGAAVVLAQVRPLTAGPVRREAGPTFAVPSRDLAGIAAAVFCILLVEGAVSNWSAVYLRTGVGAAAGVAGLGYAAFSLTMALGRFYGDRVVDRFGEVPVVQTGAAVAGIGLGAGLLAGAPLPALMGFACMGLGYAVLVPVFFRAAANTPGMAPGSSLAAVASAGYVGLFIGPPALGATADLLGITVSMALLAVLSLLVALMAGPVLNRNR